MPYLLKEAAHSNRILETAKLCVYPADAAPVVEPDKASRGIFGLGPCERFSPIGNCLDGRLTLPAPMWHTGVALLRRSTTAEK